jgi:predicted NBD/HSP70 family sugar kinase
MPSTRIGKLEELLFWEIFYRRQVVRSELARLFEVSAATISRSAGVLLAKKLILETSATPVSRGRRPTLLELNPGLAHVAGIEIDRDRITAVVTDLAGSRMGRGSIAAEARNPLAKMLQSCRRALHIAVADAGRRSLRIARIGVGHTGTLDVENGICLEWGGVPHWHRVNLREALRESFGVEITLDDRARAVALAQHLLWPENRRHRSAIYVQIGTGIGAGIFVNGRMLRGATLAGGEIGHIVIDRDGPRCTCGSRGCVEAFASLGATMARVREAYEKGTRTCLRDLVKSPAELTIDAVVEAATQGDPLARTALDETGQALGIGIANAVQLLNPSLLVLAGDFASVAQAFLLDAVTRAIHRHCLETIARGLEIRMARFRKDAGPIGCALLASVDVAQELIQRALFAASP